MSFDLGLPSPSNVTTVLIATISVRQGKVSTNTLSSYRMVSPDLFLSTNLTTVLITNSVDRQGKVLSTMSSVNRRSTLTK